MVRIDEHLEEIRRTEELLKHPRNNKQKNDLSRRLHRLRREYRQAKMYMAQSKR